MKMETQLKIYPKICEDVSDISKWEGRKKHMGAVGGSLDELVVRFRDFYKEAYSSVFNSIVKEIWLEQQMTYNGLRRVRVYPLGHQAGMIFGQFIKAAVGTSQRILTASFCFMPIATYLVDFFPEFLFFDPFKNPEKYQYPYKNITIAHMVFVYQMDNRLELLEEADRRSMSYAEFVNWAHNWAVSYNLDVGKDVYELTGGHRHWPHIRNHKIIVKKKRMDWEKSKFNFNTP